MVQVLLPARLLQEAAACAMLGAALGAVRAFLPARGRAAFVPDVLLSGVVLLVCQSYAAGYSAAGVLRLSFGPETTEGDIDALYEALLRHKNTRFSML